MSEIRTFIVVGGRKLRIAKDEASGGVINGQLIDLWPACFFWFQAFLPELACFGVHFSEYARHFLDKKCN
jgi:hypothetical protein